jgi:hypothetical protein
MSHYFDITLLSLQHTSTTLHSYRDTIISLLSQLSPHYHQSTLTTTTTLSHTCHSSITIRTTFSHNYHPTLTTTAQHSRTIITLLSPLALHCHPSLYYHHQIYEAHERQRAVDEQAVTHTHTHTHTNTHTHTHTHTHTRTRRQDSQWCCSKQRCRWYQR